MMAQSEKRVRDAEVKWKADVEEYKALLSQWKEKYNHESDCRKMLDENLRVLGRRIHEREVEGAEKQEKLEAAERQRRVLEDRLCVVHA
jgi:hypothetical protein